MALINLESKKQVIILVIALVVGVIASLLVGRTYSSQVAQERARFEEAYQQDQQVKEERYNQQMAELAQKLGEVEGRAKKAAEEAAKAIADRAKPVAEPVKPKISSLAVKTPAGKRALTVRIDSLGAVGGLLNPGDFVDVIAQLSVPTAQRKDSDNVKRSVTAMIFQNLQVLAINANLDESGAYIQQMGESALKITFAVDPQEASLLSFAEKNGKLELALRSLNEQGRKMVSTATWETLSEYVLENTGAMIDVPTKPAEVKIDDAPAKSSFQIYRGGREL